MHNSYFSVIVPVYNVEKFLPICLDSLLSQTFLNFEMVLVNDGSTDSCLNICREYQQRDPRIRVVDQPNKGLLMARRIGMRQSTGQYIVHVDSDDCCAPTLLEEIRNGIERWDADCVIYNYDLIDEAGRYLRKNPAFFANNRFFEERDRAELFEKLTAGHFNSIWVKCARRDVAGMHTDPTAYADVMLGEDVIQTAIVFSRAHRVIYLDRALYHYRYNPEGISRRIKKKHIFDFLKVKLFLYNTLFSCGFTELLPAFFRIYYHELAGHLMQMHLVCENQRAYREMTAEVNRSEIQAIAEKRRGDASIFSRITLALTKPKAFFPAKLLATLYFESVWKQRKACGGEKS